MARDDFVETSIAGRPSSRHPSLMVGGQAPAQPSYKVMRDAVETPAQEPRVPARRRTWLADFVGERPEPARSKPSSMSTSATWKSAAAAGSG